VVAEPRDASPRRAFEIADSEQGIWRCHSVFECTEACPSNVDPAGAIMNLRRRAIGHKFRALFGGGRSER
jgi:succinate dehydrogenase / fumarate reductase iron-sulfur subunit